MRVHIIGTGLLGASLGLALSGRGHTVTLEDTSPTAQQLASDLGAGEPVAPAVPVPGTAVPGTAGESPGATTSAGETPRRSATSARSSPS